MRRAVPTLLVLAFAGCGGDSIGPEDGEGDNPSPVVSSLEPSMVTAGSEAFTISVRGADFVESSSVRWDGSARPTTYVSSTELTASIPASDVSTTGEVQVVVFSPAPGGGSSSPITFVVGPRPVASVMVEPEEAELVPGETIQLAAILRAADDSPLADRDVSWSSSDESVATVDDDGRVTAVTPGPAVITATSENVDGEAEIAVGAGDVVGAEGGTVTHGTDVTLQFPAGAVEQQVAITISEGENPPAHSKLVAGTAWDLGPDGTTFDEPVTVQLSFDPGALPAGVDPSRLVVHRWNGSSWEPLGSASVDTGTGTVSGTTAKFSTFAVLEVVFESVLNGGSHVCGVVTGGRGYCWGSGDQGALGNGSAGGSLEPAAVAGDHTFRSVAPGFDHTCGLAVSGAGYCWGAGSQGQLGTGVVGDRFVPGMITGNHTFSVISPGYDHTCGLTPDGVGLCWGLNEDGQLGNGGTANQSAPVEVESDHEFVQIDGGGYHTCALDTGGRAWCWGWNSNGQLGNGNTEEQSEPTAVAGGHVFTSISAGGYHTCALKEDRSAWCWGWGAHGQLGRGTLDDADFPVQVAGGHLFDTISSGSRQTCAIATGGHVQCWGDGALGALGTGDTSDRNVPVPVAGQQSYASISSGDLHNCGIVDGDAWCWGWGDAVGLGAPIHALAPVKIAHPLLTTTAPAAKGSLAVPRVNPATTGRKAR